MSMFIIESDDGKLASAAAVLRVRATNAEYNQTGAADRSSRQAWWRRLDQNS